MLKFSGRGGSLKRLFFITQFCLIFSFGPHSFLFSQEELKLQLGERKAFPRSIAAELNTRTKTLGTVTIEEETLKQFVTFTGEMRSFNQKGILHESIGNATVNFKGITKTIQPKKFEIGNFKAKDKLKYAIKYLDITCGLPSNKIVSITQDSSNNIWLAYGGSVAKLLPNSILVYDASVGFPDFPVSKLLWQQGKLYVGTFGGGLIVLKDQSYTQYTVKTGFITDLVIDLAALDKTLYVATYGVGLLEITPNNECRRLVSTSLNKKANRTINSVCTFKNKLYFTVDGGYAYKQNEQMFVYLKASGLPEDNYTVIHLNKKGDVLLGAEKNFLIKVTEEKVATYASYKKTNNAINSIFTAASGKTWLCTNGDGVYDVSDDTYMRVSEEDGLADNYALAVLQDVYNNLWITTANGGISLFSPSNFSNLETDHWGIRVLAISSKNELMYEGKKGGIDIRSKKSVKHLRHPDLTNLTGIVEDTLNNCFWVCSNKGLFKLKNNALSLIEIIRNGKAIGNHLNLILDKKNHLWISDYNYGIFYLNGKACDHFPKWSDNENTLVFSSHSDKRGNIWVCADKGNLSCFRSDSIINYKLLNKGIPLKLFSVCETEDGELYFATNIGIVKYKKETFYKIKIPYPIKSESIQSLIYDKDSKKMWAATLSDLISLSKTDSTYTNQNYNIGIYAFNFNTAIKDKNNNIYWGTANGILKYQPFHFRHLDMPRFIQIESLTVSDIGSDWKTLKDNNKLSYDSIVNTIPQGLSLHEDYNRLELSFNCKNWGKEEQTLYFYRIKNRSDVWISLGKNGVLSLQNLPGGHYSIELKAELQDGISSKALVYDITIKKPFYKELSFIILISCSILLIIWLIINKYSEFNFEHFSVYGTDTLLINKTRMLCFTAVMLALVIDYFHSEISHRYVVNWPFNFVLILTCLAVLFYTYYKKVNRKYLEQFVKATYLFFCTIYIHRAYLNNFDPIIAIEVALIFLFSVFIFQNVKSIFIFSGFIVATVSIALIVSEANPDNKSLFLSATLQALINVFLFTLIESKKLSKMLFSDKILNSSEQFIIVSNEKGEIVFTNNYMAESLGLEVKEILNNGWWRNRGWDIVKIVRERNKLIDHIKSGKSKRYNNSFFNKKEGNLIYIEWQDTPIEGKYMLGIGKDITTEILQKDEIQKTLENTRLLSEIGKEISSIFSIENIIEKIYLSVNQLMDASVFGIGIYDKKSNNIYFRGVIENNEKLGEYSYSLNETHRPSVQCYINQKEYVINNYERDYGKNRSVAKQGHLPEGIIYVPLTYGDKKIGVITVQSFRVNAYTDYHLQLLKGLATFTSIALDNASLYTSLEKRVEERTNEIQVAYNNTRLLSQIAEDISSSLSIGSINEKVYNNVNKLMDASMFGIGLYNAKTNTLDFKGFRENSVVMNDFYFSLNDEERIAVKCYNSKKEIFITDYSNEYKEYVSEKLAPITGNQASSLIYIPVFSKNVAIGVLTVQSTRTNVYTDYHLSILKNLAVSIGIALENANLYQNLEEKVEERTLEIVKQRDELEKLSLVAKKVNNGVIITDYNDNIEWVNDSFLNLMGYSLSDLIGKRPIDVFSGEGTSSEMKTQIIEKRIKSDFELLQYTKNKERKWLLINTTPLYDEQNKLLKNIEIITDITERKKLEERHRYILNNAGDVIYTCDRNGNFDFMNMSVTKTLGYMPAELFGKHFSSIVHPDDKKRISLFYLKQFKKKLDNSYLEFRVLTLNRETIWVAQTVNFISDSFGEISGFQSVVRDITFKKNAEQEKQIKDEQQYLFNEALKELSLKSFDEFATIHDFYKEVCAKIAKALKIERTGIWSVKPEYIVCESLYMEGKSFDQKERILHKKEFPVYFEAVSKGLIVSATNVFTSPALGEFRNDYFNADNVKSLLDVPIRSNGELVGIVCCEKSTEIKNWTEQDENFVKSMADLISINIEADKRKQAETKIKESEANFRLLDETIDDVFWLYDLENSKILYKSPSAFKVFGFNFDVFYSSDSKWREFVFEEDLNTINKAHNRMKTEGFYDIEYRIKTIEGVRWIAEKAFGIKDKNNKYTKCSGICSDISLRKESQKVINQLSLVAQKTENIIIITNPLGFIEWTNDAFTKLTGYHLEEVIGKKPGTFLQGELTDLHVMQRIGMGLKSKINIKEQIINYTKSGRHYWLELNIDPVFDEKGELINFIAVEQDITERKLKEQVIEKQNFDIVSSINYAKRIQKALLPGKAYFESLPVELGLYYKPKDIIGGDFYWVDQIGSKLILAVGDCTGHGVPGAMMSALGINGLINSVTEQKITDPASILSYLDSYIYGILNSNESEEIVNDGMDIGVVSIDLEHKTISFAGAGRPLYYYHDTKLQKIEGSRRSISSNALDMSFETVVLPCLQDACFYMFSDGMTDQFGGDRNKRLGSRKFAELLEQIGLIPIVGQTKFIIDFYNDWKKNSTQTDDMVWLAFKLN